MDDMRVLTKRWESVSTDHLMLVGKPSEPTGVREKAHVSSVVSVHHTVLPKIVELMNISFKVEKTASTVSLTCDKWPSLSSFGENFQEAVEGAFLSIRFALKQYGFAPEGTLTRDAVEFKKFLIANIMK